MFRENEMSMAAFARPDVVLSFGTVQVEN